MNYSIKDLEIRQLESIEQDKMLIRNAIKSTWLNSLSRKNIISYAKSNIETSKKLLITLRHLKNRN